MMSDKLKQRWHAKEATWGHWLKQYGGKGLALVGAIGELANAANLMPQGFVLPPWARTAIFVCAAINFVVGKMSTGGQKDDKNRATN